MNEHIEIKELLDRYYEGETTDADEQRLREYFTSDEVVAGLQPYRSIFAYLKHEKENLAEEAAIIPLPAIQQRRVIWWYAAAAAVACLLVGTFLAHENRPVTQTACTGTYVMVNGICYDDMALVKKYATETIDMVTQPFGSSVTDALDFLDDSEIQKFNDSKIQI